MTLREVLARSKTPPKVGDHEIVVGPDTMAHILVITHVDFENPVETHMDWDCPCRAIKTGNPMDFEVAPSITCLQCMLL